MHKLKKAKSDGMPEDEERIWHDDIQEMTDKHIKQVDAALESKQEEIMQV